MSKSLTGDHFESLFEYAPVSLWEEDYSGIKLNRLEMAFSTVMHRMEEEERVDFFIHVNRWPGEPFNAEPDKCDDLRWADIHQLPVNIVPYIRRALENHHAGIPFEEFRG